MADLMNMSIPNKHVYLQQEMQINCWNMCLRERHLKPFYILNTVDVHVKATVS